MAKEIGIYDDSIKLDQFVKFSGACITGGEAKLLVKNGEVMLNGEVCTMRAQKVHVGDSVTISGEEYVVTKEKDLYYR